jgi:hypothetical protein
VKIQQQPGAIRNMKMATVVSRNLTEEGDAFRFFASPIDWDYRAPDTCRVLLARYLTVVAIGADSWASVMYTDTIKNGVKDAVIALSERVAKMVAEATDGSDDFLWGIYSPDSHGKDALEIAKCFDAKAGVR